MSPLLFLWCLISTKLGETFVGRSVKHLGWRLAQTPYKILDCGRNDNSGTFEAAPSAWVIRCHDDRDGRHRWRRNLRESFRGSAPRSHAVSDPRRLGTRRLYRDVRRFYLG